MIKKKLFFVILIFFLVFFISCNKNRKINKTKTTKFTLYSPEITEKKTFDDEVATEITRITGVELDFIGNPPVNQDFISVMIANADYPDLIYAKGSLGQLIEANAVIPLDNYIDLYGQNIKKLYGNQLSKLRNSKENPHIYTVGTFNVHPDNFEISGTMQLQNAVLREFGYPSINTLEEFENAMLTYKKNYPVIEGHKTIGLSLLTDSWYWYLSLSNPGNYVIGYPNDGQWIVDQNTLKVTYKFLHPEMKKFYKWLNKLYHEDLLDPESFTQNYDVWFSKMSAGYVLGTSYPYWELTKIRENLINAGKESRTYAYLPVTVSKDVKDPTLKDYGYSGGWGIAISVSCKNPEKAFKFLDWFCSEEAQILVNWGIKDKHYYLNKEGKRVAVENLNDEISGVGKWIYPFPQAGNSFIDSTGNYLGKINSDNLRNSFTQTEKDTLEAYGAECWIDLFPKAEELGVSKHGQIWQYNIDSHYTEQLDVIDEYVKQELITMIISDSESFDDLWNEMQKNIINMNIKDIEEILNNLIQSKIEVWNIK